MPSSAEILAGLETAANEWRGLAIAWHAALAVFLVLFILGRRPGRRLVAILLAAPLGSVSAFAYAYASPLGLIPCPSLSAVLGVALAVRGLESRRLSFMLAAAGVLYGVVGVFRLGVVIDVVLLAGALMLVPVVARPLPGVAGRVPAAGRSGG